MINIFYIAFPLFYLWAGIKAFKYASETRSWFYKIGVSIAGIICILVSLLIPILAYA